MINLSMAEPDNILRPHIAVMGVGGAGGNAINNMINSKLQGCDFIAANTDSQALAMSLASHKIQLGINLSRGLGAGSKPEIGRAAAEEQLADILAALEGADMLFVTAGMGGGTGTGAAPVIARAAREAGILTVGVVTKPFHFEGGQRMRQADSGIGELQQYVDTLIVIPNQNLFRIANERTTFAEAFRLADEVLYSGVRGITDLMVMPGFMNLDFADVKTVMLEMGKAMMGTGEAEGDNRAINAAEAAISNPLLDDISMKGARGVLINITGGMDMTLFEVDQAANRIREEVDPEAQIKVGSTLGEDLQGKIRVSVIATGIDAALAEQQKKKSEGIAAAAAQRASAAAAAQALNTAPRTMVQMPRAQMQEVTPSAAKPAFQQAPAVSQPTVSAQPQAQVQQPQPQVQAQPTTPVQHTAQINVATSSFFAMPQMMTPEMLAGHQTTTSAAQPTTQSSYETPRTTSTASEPAPGSVQALSMAARQAEMLLATQAAASPRPMQTPATKSARPMGGVNSPLRSAPQAPRTTETAQDIRVTQLTTPALQQPTNELSPQGTQRARSLFQRITGLGFVRPSAHDDLEDDLVDHNLPKEEEQPRLGVDPTDRPALSASSEQPDLLDIPAFLRRQTNH